MNNFKSSYAQLPESFYSVTPPTPVAVPKLLKWNSQLAEELGLKFESIVEKENIFSGNSPLNGTPIAQKYAGHQFGQFNPDLGDGRAHLLAEVISTKGERYDIALKGSGRTPYSRGGDGRAWLGPVLREYIVSEAMYNLGIPTTRALAIVSSGEPVYREAKMPGAIITRIAKSHIRIGTFQWFSATSDISNLQTLLEYSIKRHYPDAKSTADFLRAVCLRQAELVAEWMRVGFIHGVMNTDNTAISGQTIDYGPCAFMDAFSPKTVFSSIDSQGRYAYGNQPSILLWNLMRLAETLVKLVDVNEDRSIELLTDEAKNLASAYDEIWLTNMRAKIGLKTNKNGDAALIQKLLDAMEEGEADFTLTFRKLSDAIRGDNTAARQQFKNPELFDLWENDWRPRLEQEPMPNDNRAVEMDKVNPLYIPRNHRVEEALSKAVDYGNLSVFEDLLSVISEPFEEVTGNERFTEPAPKTSVPYQTFCGT